MFRGPWPEDVATVDHEVEFSSVGRFRTFRLGEGAAPTALGLIVLVYPALTRWANICRASGAFGMKAWLWCSPLESPQFRFQYQESSRSLPNCPLPSPPVFL